MKIFNSGNYILSDIWPITSICEVSKRFLDSYIRSAMNDRPIYYLKIGVRPVKEYSYLTVNP